MLDFQTKQICVLNIKAEANLVGIILTANVFVHDVTNTLMYFHELI